MKNKKKIAITSLIIALITLTSILLSSCGNKAVKIGAQSGTIAYYTIAQNDEGGKNVKRKGYVSPALAIIELGTGNLDAVLVDDQVAMSLVESNSNKIKMIKTPVDSGEFAFAMKKGNDEFTNKVNEWIDKNQNKIEEYKKDPSKIKPIKIDKYKAGNNDDTKLVLYTSPDYPPYESKDGDNFVGIDIQIAKDMADEWGLKLELAEFNFDGLIPALKTSTAKHSICMAGLTVNEERKKQMNFSKTYVKTNQVLIVKKNNNKYDKLTQEQLYNLVVGKK